MLKAQMRDDTRWRAVTICNVSSRGLMTKCSAPLAKGAYIELRLSAAGGALLGKSIDQGGARCR